MFQAWGTWLCSAWLRGDVIKVDKYLKGHRRQMDEVRLFSVVCSDNKEQ